MTDQARPHIVFIKAARRPYDRWCMANMDADAGTASNGMGNSAAKVDTVNPRQINSSMKQIRADRPMYLPKEARL